MMAALIRLTFSPSKLAWFAGQAFLSILLATAAPPAFPQGIPVKPNITDALGHRQGEWVVYFDKYWNETDDPLLASYYRLIEYEDNIPTGVTADYYRSGVKQWEGILVGDRPDQYAGKQTWFYENGARKTVAFFENNKAKEAESFLRDGSPADAEWLTNFHDAAYEAFEGGDFARSARLFEQALAHAEAIHDLQSEACADIFVWLSIVYHELGDTERVLQFDLALLEVYTAIRPPGDEDLMQTMHDVARGFRVTTRYRQAADAYKQFLDHESRHFNGFHEMHGRALTGLGETFLELVRYDEAQHSLFEAQEFYEQHPPAEPMEVELLNTVLSRAHFLTGQWTTGKKLLLDELRQIEQRFGKKSSAYRAKLAYLGNFYKMNGQLREAASCFTTAIESFESNPTDAIVMLSAVIPLIEVYVQSGQGYHADQLIEKTRSILKGMHPETPGYATMYYAFVRRLCDYYDFSGNLKAKERSLTELTEISLGHFGTSSVEYIQSITLNAEHHLAMNRAVVAWELLQPIVPSLDRYVISSDAREIRAMAKLAQLVGTSAFLSGSTGPDVAISALENSLRVYNHLPEQNFVPEKIDVYLTLAMISETEMDYGAADAFYNRCLNEVERKFSRAHPYYANILFAIAKKSEVRNDIATSHRYYRAAIDAHGAYIRDVFPHLSTEDKERFYQANAEWIENFKSFAVTHAEREPSLAGDLYDLLLASKGIVLRSVRGIRSSIARENNPSAAKLYEEWVSSKNRVVRLYQQRGNDNDLQALVADINRMEKQLSELSATFNEWNRGGHTWKQVQSMLKSGDAAIEIAHVIRQMQSDSLYVALVITKGVQQPRIVTIGRSHKMESRDVMYYRNAIRFKLEDTRSYDIFWRPLASALRGISRVYLSPDGIYHQISLATLFNTVTNRFVLQETDIHLLGSTAQLIAPGKPLVGRPKSCVIIAHPDYGKTSSAYPQERSFSLTNVTDLPGTQGEQAAVAGLLSRNGVAVKEFSEGAATEEVAKSVENPSVLHIATHGYFLKHAANANTSYIGIDEGHIAENPLLLSGLLLAGCRNEVWKENALTRSHREDGILTAFEASTLRLDETDLVVLSACETGLGELRNGEGVYGLQRAFAMAGAARIVMSLWKVDDAATQAFMTFFYSNWLEGQEVNAAFRSAQESLKEKHAHPYYWGAFVLVGNQ